MGAGIPVPSSELSWTGLSSTRMSRFSSPDIITIMVIKEMNGLANVEESGKITQKLRVKPIRRPDYPIKINSAVNDKVLD
ncbi:unnamed protein product [Acanthoscelides obtectus]|uniref:Uncharacterized protein n=1 Tax=Acanthoscelides obtectus TaxID=200917 RepID=A0A9P0Q395_ACAOB|nr:unnamed protein product [Acanthoscelides obtectus]CAK1674237.1 hypothetical protein AOBTE_LOCUS29561 [Acanthoscelides obtectus]